MQILRLFEVADLHLQYILVAGLEVQQEPVCKVDLFFLLFAARSLLFHTFVPFQDIASYQTRYNSAAFTEIEFYHLQLVDKFDLLRVLQIIVRIGLISMFLLRSMVRILFDVLVLIQSAVMNSHSPRIVMAIKSDSSMMIATTLYFDYFVTNVMSIWFHIVH